MRANTIQTNFTSGEVSPLMYGRVDVNKYANGAKILKNMIVRPQGGITRRPGTQFIGGAKTANYTRIISFVVSNTLSYILEFGAGYIRFYTGGGIVVDGSSDPVEVVTPYTINDLDQIQVTQSADVMYVAHPLYPPQVLTRFSNISWTFAPYVAEDGPYLDVDTSGNRAQLTLVSDITTLNSSFSTNNTTLTASTAEFSSGSVGKYVQINIGFYALLNVTAFVDTTHVTGSLIPFSQVYLNGGPLTFSGGVLTAPSAAFTTASVGLFTKAGGTTWYVITGFVDSHHVNATALTMQSTGSATLTITGGFISGSVGQFVDYEVGGAWFLALILTVVNSSQATVQVQNNIWLNDVSVDIAIAAGAVGTSVAVTSSFSGVFFKTDVGKYIRSTTTQSWVLITSFNSSSKVTGTVVNMFPYTFPSTVMTLADDRAIIVTVAFTASVFDATDVGTLVRFQFAAQWRWLQITVVASGNAVTGILSDFIPYDLVTPTIAYNGGFADTIQFGAWCNRNGFPAIVGFHEQRLIFANSTLQPSTFWMSQPGDYLNMAPTEEDGSVIATDAISLTLATGTVDPVTWIRSGQVLLMGTFNSEYEIVDPTGLGLSPTNIAATGQSFYGSLSPTTAFRFGVATLFLQRGGNKLREMLYQFQFNAFNSKDISIISEHIMRVRGGAKIMAYQVDPVSIFWIVCNNGDLVSVTYDRDQDVVAFTEHTIANGFVESVAVVPNTNRDDVYLIVRRQAQTFTYRYIEMISPLFDTDTGDTLLTMNFLDAHTNYTGAPATTISGLNYLINVAQVYAIADGKVQGPFTVDIFAGTITLTTAASNVTVGLLYSSTFGSLSPEGGSQLGTSQGKRKTIKEISARVKDSLSFKHGQSLSTLTLIDAANFGGDLIPVASQGQLYTGDVRFSPDMAWDQQATYYLVQDMPYPLTIDALMPILVNNE